MVKNSNILQHYKGYELLIKKLDEGIYRYNRSYINIDYGFFNSDEIKVIESYLGNQVPYCLFGGYEDALRKMLVIGENIDFHNYICCLGASFNSKFNSIDHRDVKGALYNMGVDPDKFGDFWVEDNHIYIYCCEDISSFLCNDFTQVGHCSIQLENVEFKAQIFQFQSFNINVNSLRLDKIIADIIHKSREKAKEKITAGMVNVNYQTIEDCSFLCNNNDILSVRGFGRFKLSSITENPKSGKMIVRIDKYV